jgi:hypothetical protein
MTKNAEITKLHELALFFRKHHENLKLADTQDVRLIYYADLVDAIEAALDVELILSK